MMKNTDYFFYNINVLLIIILILFNGILIASANKILEIYF